MRHVHFVWLPLAVAIFVFMHIEPGLAEDAKRNKEKATTSSAITAEQLDTALLPIRSEMDALRLENERLKTLVASPAPSAAPNEGVEQKLQTIRIALVVMGVGMLGALLKLRRMARKLDN